MNATTAPLTAASYEVAVAKKQQASTKEQGEQAVQLIRSAAGGSPPPGTGSLLNVQG